MNTLKISPDLDLPIDAATQTIAILARKRVGKTYTASVFAEELIEAKIPFVVLDPTGAWWGLRSSSDGQRDGYPVIIIGGSHADVPLEETAGKVIADLVVDHPGYYIIDFTHFESDASVQRFSTEFAKRFYFRKEQHRFAMQLIIDEADVFIPQQPFDNQKVMLGAFDVIVRRGGIRGIGVTIISQRPAVVNKNVLTQCETMIALQISGSQDVDAIEHWIRLHGSKEEKEKFLATIGSLQMGIAWFWSPSWLQVFKQIHIRKRKTFNSSATPKAGEKVIVPKKLAAIDIEKLGNEIKATITKQKENEPDELKRRLAKAESELKKLQHATPSPVKTEIKEVPVFSKEQRAEIRAVQDAISKLQVDIEDRIAKIIAPLVRIEKIASEKFPADLGFVARDKARSVERIPAPQRTHQPHTPQANDGSFSPDRCQRACLGVLAQFPEGCSINKLALLAGYSLCNGFKTELSGLRTAGCITGGNTEIINITSHGMKFAQYDELPAPGIDRIRFFRNHKAFDKCQRAVIDALTGEVGGLTIDELAAKCDPPYAVCNGFKTELSGLRTAGVIIGKNTESIRLNPEMVG